jgi:hypothetical protein
MNITITDIAVFKDGKAIGRISGNKCLLSAPIGPTVKSAVNKKAGRKLVYYLVPDHEVVTKEQPLCDPSPYAPEWQLRGFPPPPETHPELGQKDPVYVAWYRQHYTPAEFTAKYGDKHLPTMAEFHKAKEKSGGFINYEVKDGEN